MISRVDSLSRTFFRITNMRNILPGAYKEDGPCPGGTFWASTDRIPFWIRRYLLWRNDARVNYKAVSKVFDEYIVHVRITTKENPWSNWQGGVWKCITQDQYEDLLMTVEEDSSVENIEFYLIKK